MTILQFVLNVILAVLAFHLVVWLFSLLTLAGPFITVLALLAAIGTFFANFAARIRG